MSITYIEKGYGLQIAIQAAGHWLAQINGDWQSDDDAAVQAIIDGYTLDQCKEYHAAQAALRAQAYRDALVWCAAIGGLSAEGAAYLSSGDANDAQILGQYADNNGLPLRSLALLVTASAEDVDGLIATSHTSRMDTILGLPDFTVVTAYMASPAYVSGWLEG